MRDTDPEGAIQEFLGLPALSEEKTEIGFKGLKQAIKLEFKLGLYDKVCRRVSRKCSTTSNFHVGS